MARIHLPKAYSKYGASMGRAAVHADDRTAPIVFRVQRVDLDAGGYDSGGAYWGTGVPLYIVQDDHHGVEFYLRADSRDAAKAKARESYPNARFYR